VPNTENNEHDACLRPCPSASLSWLVQRAGSRAAAFVRPAQTAAVSRRGASDGIRRLRAPHIPSGSPSRFVADAVHGVARPSSSLPPRGLAGDRKGVSAPRRHLARWSRPRAQTVPPESRGPVLVRLFTRPGIRLYHHRRNRMLFRLRGDSRRRASPMPNSGRADRQHS